MKTRNQIADEQGYIAEPVFQKPPACINCHYFSCNEVTVAHKLNEWNERKNKICNLGNFPVKSLGTCNKFKAKS